MSELDADIIEPDRWVRNVDNVDEMQVGNDPATHATEAMDSQNEAIARAIRSGDHMTVAFMLRHVSASRKSDILWALNVKDPSLAQKVAENLEVM